MLFFKVCFVFLPDGSMVKTKVPLTFLFATKNVCIKLNTNKLIQKKKKIIYYFFILSLIGKI